MRTERAHILLLQSDGTYTCCPYCNYDHDPDMQCWETPESVRFQLPEPKLCREIERITRDGKVVAVKHVYREK